MKEQIENNEPPYYRLGVKGEIWAEDIGTSERQNTLTLLQRGAGSQAGVGG